MDILENVITDIISQALKGILCDSPKVLNDRESFRGALCKISSRDKRLTNLLLISMEEEIPEIICSTAVVSNQLRTSLIKTLYDASGCEERFSNQVIDIWIKTYELIKASDKMTIDSTLPINALRFEDDTHKNEIVTLQNCIQDIRLSETDIPQELLDPLSNHGFITVEDVLVSSKQNLYSARLSNTDICVLVEHLRNLNVPEGTAPFYRVFTASLTSEVDDSINELYKKIFNPSGVEYASIYKRALKKLKLYPNISIQRLIHDSTIATKLIENNINNVRDLVQLSATDFLFMDDFNTEEKMDIIECLDNNKIPLSFYDHLRNAASNDVEATLSEISIYDFEFSVMEFGCLQKNNVNNLWDLWLLYCKKQRGKAGDPNELYLCPGRTLHSTNDIVLNSLPEDLQIIMDKTMQRLSNYSIRTLGLSPQSYICLERAHIRTLGGIIGCLSSDFSEIQDLTTDGKNEIMNRLRDYGF